MNPLSRPGDLPPQRELWKLDREAREAPGVTYEDVDVDVRDLITHQPTLDMRSLNRIAEELDLDRPLGMVRDFDGRQLITDGNHRLAAAMMGGAPTVRVSRLVPPPAPAVAADPRVIPPPSTPSTTSGRRIDFTERTPDDFAEAPDGMRIFDPAEEELTEEFEDAAEAFLQTMEAAAQAPPPGRLDALRAAGARAKQRAAASTPREPELTPPRDVPLPPSPENTPPAAQAVALTQQAPTARPSSVFRNRPRAATYGSGEGAPQVEVLGAGAAPDTLKVRWPSGNTTEEPSYMLRLTSQGLTGGLVGGLLGSALDSESEDSEVSEAGFGGAGAGFLGGALLGPQIAKRLPELGPAAHLLGRRALNAYKANLLTSKNLPANAIGAPVGTTVLTGIEDILGGNTARGTEILKNLPELFRPSKLKKAWDDSEDVILRANDTYERADASPIADLTNPTAFDQTTALPARAMTTGDIQARGVLRDAAERTGLDPGAAEDFARTASLTGRVEWPLLQKFADLPRGSTVGGFLLPFSGTPARIISEGADRTPGLGVVMNILRGMNNQAEHPAHSLRQMAAQQGLGTALGVGAYNLGQEAEDLTDRAGNSAADLWALNALRGAVSNLSGRYSLPVTMGFGAGAAANTWQDWQDQLDETAPAGIRQGMTEFPLPSLEAPVDLVNNIAKGLADPPSDAEDVLELLPSGVIPGVLRDYLRGNLPQRPPWEWAR